MERVIFGGVDLSERFICLVRSRHMPSVDASLEHVSGSDRYVAMGATYLPEPIVVRLVAPSAGRRERRRLARFLGGALYRREPDRLYLSDDDGLYRMAMVVDQPDFEELVVGGSVEVKFQPMHAAMYGETHSATVPSGGSVTVMVEGTYPSTPTVSASAATGETWGIRLDNADFLHVPKGSYAQGIEIDCERRTCLVGGLVSLPTLDSDWLELAPGEHTLANDMGGGAATVTWTERWL